MNLKIQLIILCFLLIVAVSPSFPQPSGMGMKKWRGEHPCWGASELNLSQEQRKSFDRIQLAYFREAQTLRLQLLTKNFELRELLINPTTTTESIRVKYLEILELQSKQEEKAIEYLIKVRNLLTPEQLKNWCPEQEFPSFRHRMHRMGPMGPMHQRKAFPPPE
jgi:Spy/CpxP family protein refolding chaperone